MFSLRLRAGTTANVAPAADERKPIQANGLNQRKTAGKGGLPTGEVVGQNHVNVVPAFRESALGILDHDRKGTVIHGSEETRVLRKSNAEREEGSTVTSATRGHGILYHTHAAVPGLIRPCANAETGEDKRLGGSIAPFLARERWPGRRMESRFLAYRPGSAAGCGLGAWQIAIDASGGEA